MKEWKEFIEEEKTLYAIVPVRQEEDVIYVLELIKTYYPIYPYTNHVSTLYTLTWDGADEIRLSKRIIRSSWNGTGTEHVISLAIESLVPETPWFFNLRELERVIKSFGVKETQKMILEGIIESMVCDTLGDV